MTRRYRYRSAVTGHFVTAAYAKRYPKRTIRETREVSRGPFDRGWSRIICVASGPSLAYGNQKEIIRAECGRGRWRVFVVNRKFEDFPDADVLYGADRPFWNRYHPAIAAGFRGELWTGDSGAAKAYRLHHVPIDRGIDQRTRLQAGLSRDPKRIRTSGNSGHDQVALAHAFGGKVIALCGFDMQLTGGHVNKDGILVGGPIHDHGPHDGRLANPQASALKNWADRFAVTARDLATAGTRVINCTVETALRCFERADLRETIEKYSENHSKEAA